MRYPGRKGRLVIDRGSFNANFQFALNDSFSHWLLISDINAKRKNKSLLFEIVVAFNQMLPYVGDMKKNPSNKKEVKNKSRKIRMSYKSLNTVAAYQDVKK